LWHTRACPLTVRRSDDGEEVGELAVQPSIEERGGELLAHMRDHLGEVLDEVSVDVDDGVSERTSHGA
jgi:hypothetical protein